MATLGVVVFSLSGMKHLAQTLESVRWADAILVLHVGEGEPLIAVPSLPALVVRKIATAREVEALYPVPQNAPHASAGMNVLNFPEGQRPKATDVSPWSGVYDKIETDWYLHLWGDEYVEPVLGDELRAICQLDLYTRPRSYRIPIRTMLLGRWVEGSLWGASPAVRLSRGVEGIGYGWWSDAKPGKRDPMGLLRGWIGDYASVELSDAVQRVNRVTNIWAEGLQQRGLHPHPAAISLISMRVFLRLLVRNGVVAKGMAGLTLSSLAAYATLLCGAKLWEARNVVRRKPST